MLVYNPLSETQTILFPLIFIFQQTFSKQPLLTVEHDQALSLGCPTVQWGRETNAINMISNSRDINKVL